MIRLNKFLLLIIFLIPLLEANRNFGFESIKVLFFILSITLIGLLWLFTKSQLKWDLIKIASLVFILVLFITSSLGVDFRSSLLGKEPYFQSLILYAYLFLFSLLVFSTTIKNELEEVAIVLSVSAALVSFLAIKDWILLNIFSTPVPIYAGRVISTFGQPNFYAGFLLLTLPLAYFLLKSSDQKLSYLGWGSGVLSMIGILVSYSRLAIFLSLILLILGLVNQIKIKFRLVLIISLVLAASFVVAWNYSSGIISNEFSPKIVVSNPDLTSESVEKRSYIWPEAVKIALQRPMIGYGLENIGLSFANYFKDNKHPLFEENLTISPVLISLKELNIDRSHNYMLDLLLFSGIFGLLAWILLVGLLFGKLKQTKIDGRSKNVLVVSLITYLIWIQFQNQSVVHLIYFWLLIGLIDKEND